jgi:hypothetical protein
MTARSTAVNRFRIRSESIQNPFKVAVNEEFFILSRMLNSEQRLV